MSELEKKVLAAAFLLEIFDRVPEVVVFVKDVNGRYVAVNETLARRLGLGDKRQAIGRTARDLFPAPLGDRYLAQDLLVLRTARPIADLLELHLYPNRHEGWCLTTKVPIRGSDGALIGLAGTSRDLSAPEIGKGPLDDFAEAVRLIHERVRNPLRVDELADAAGLSAYQFGRRIRRLFGLTPARLITRVRVDAACRMLQEENESIAEVAQACGYCDQSAFTRQFKAVVGMPPARYREHHRRQEARPGRILGKNGTTGRKGSAREK